MLLYMPIPCALNALDNALDAYFSIFSTSWGVNLGTSFSHNILEKNSVNIIATPIKKERYFYWKAILAPTLRFFINKPANKYGAYLDLSLCYNLPVIFRYVGINNNTRISQKYIHQYKDFSVLARTGINQGVAITTEYRIFDYLKNQYIAA